jgi:hypothetical protein
VRIQVGQFSHPACGTATTSGIIVDGLTAACASVNRTGEPKRWRQPFGIVTACFCDRRSRVREHRVTKTRCILQRRFPNKGLVRMLKSLTSTVTHYLMHLG